MEQDRNYIERKFGHCEVNWEIRNLYTSWYNVKAHFDIFSPDFYIRSSPVTKWRMMLHMSEPEGTLRHRLILFELQRLECGGNSELVSTECKLFFPANRARDRSQEFLPVKYFRFRFQPNAIFRTKQLLSLHHTLVYSRPLGDVSFEPSILKIRLQMLAHFPGTKETFATCSDLAITKLSQNLYDLYETMSQNRDICLLIGDEVYTAHKAVLCSRIKNEVLKKDIGKSEIYRLDQENNCVAWNSIFRFLYSADISHAVMEPSIVIFEKALSLGIDAITAYYEPERLYLCSTIDVDEYSLTWTIDDFFDRKEAMLLGPSIMIDATGMKARLLITPKKYIKQSEYTIIAMNTEGGKGTYCSGIFVQNTNTRLYLHVIHVGIMGKWAKGRSVFNRKALENFFQTGSITFGFKLQMVNFRLFSGIKTIVRCEPFSEQLNYARLSQDMSSLWKDGKFADTEIPVFRKMIRIPAHTCILSARCSISLLERLKEGYEKYSETFTDNPVQYLLEILYCGKINSCISVSTSRHLYEIGEEFNETFIKYSVLSNLKKHLSERNAREAYEFAASKNIESLKIIASLLLGNSSKGESECNHF